MTLPLRAIFRRKILGPFFELFSRRLRLSSRPEPVIIGLTSCSYLDPILTTLARPDVAARAAPFESEKLGGCALTARTSRRAAPLCFHLTCFRSACLLLTLAVPYAAHAQDPPVTGVYAIVGAKIEVGDGRVIDKGTILIRDGLIVGVGPKLTVPPDAEVIKGDGLTVYPGFIDADATQGLQLPDAKPDQDVAPDRTEEASPAMRLANRKGV